MPGPLDALLLKMQSGLDDFVTEKYADEMAGVLALWSSSLLRSPQDLTTIERAFLPSFLGFSPRPVESRVVRQGQIEIRHNTFKAEAVFGRDAFLQELRSAMSGFSKILTADLQVTSIDADPVPAAMAPVQIHTRIRYELVGEGPGFHREQRVGYWLLAWERSASNELRLKSWLSGDETRSRSAGPGYVDIAAGALGSNGSYSSQLLHGADYWRTVLDGACGIDIYGHNGVSVGDIDGDGFDDLYGIASQEAFTTGFIESLWRRSFLRT